MTPDDTAHIKSKEDLVAFIERVRADYSQNGDNWENQDIPTFLEAFQAWLGSSQNYYRNMKIDQSSVTPWRQIADAFAAARIYE